LIFGIVAALTVPLFLNMISSTLLEGARTKPVDFFAFAGFCLIYVVSSRRFVENVAQRLMGQIDQVKREVGHLKQQKRDEPVVMPAKIESEPVKPVEPEPKEVLSYNDVEILRALVEESFVYGNLAAICERTGLNRDFISQRLTIMKAMGVIETRINDKNVLYWGVSVRGKAVLGEIFAGQEDKKIA
jgi:DNA-binding transcriptional ArsR family regulator